jgi:hypothetical protein
VDFFYLTSCRNKPTAENNQAVNQNDTMHQTKDNTFEEHGAALAP